MIGIIWMPDEPVPMIPTRRPEKSTPSSGHSPLWNQRPRDVANLARWIGDQNEHYLNWQIVNLKAPGGPEAIAAMRHCADAKSPNVAEAPARN